MTAKDKRHPKKGNESQEPAPFFSSTLLGVLLIAAVVSGVGTYYYNRPAPPPDPHNKNPNVIKLRAVPKDRHTPFQPSTEHTYWAEHVIPYIKKNQKEVQNCYFGYKGKFRVNPKGYLVMLQLSIDQKGKPTVSFHKERTKLDVKPILECILQKAGEWKFAPHKSAKPISDLYPLFFR